MTCSCFHCAKAAVEADPRPNHLRVLGFDPRLARMFLCGLCGNKRCPHAADHRNSCTGSNDPGQKGSLYESVPCSCDSDASLAEKLQALSPEGVAARAEGIAKDMSHD